ncbi:MAG TPA: hypothetical protein VF875_07415 [Anaeromyxobacter sp.]
MRSVACLGLALAACGSEAGLQSGPLDRMHRPTGLAVLDGRLLVASSNADLRYDQDTGGAILALDPGSLDTVRVDGALNVRSFAGELAVARTLLQTAGAPEADHCGPDISDAARAVFATRGSNTLNVLSVDAGGRMSCRFCGIRSSGAYADPFPAAIACAPGKPRAFVGYLGAQLGQGWLSEIDLLTGGVHTATIGAGLVRSLAYDAAHDRLYVAQLATSQPTPLRWVELGGCTFGAASAAIGCSVSAATIPGIPAGSEIRSIALAHPFPGAPQRAYVTVRLYDLASASIAGGRTTDYGGLLVVVDLVEDAHGGVTPTLVRIVPESGTLGRGLQDVRVLPARFDGVGNRRRDVVATTAVDEGILWIHDDESLELASFGRDAVTGASVLGHSPAGLAVDPDVVGSTARLWVGSFQDDFVTPIDVPLDAPWNANFTGGTRHRISGGTP